MAKRIITINRMFGSNGRLIGKTLAEKKVQPIAINSVLRLP